MFTSWKRACTYACLALMLLEASCTSPGGGLVPGNPAAGANFSTSDGAGHDGQRTAATIVSCRIVTPQQRTVLNPPPAQTVRIPRSFDSPNYVFYFEIGVGNWCYSLPQPLDTSLPGNLDARGSRVTFGAGHNKLVLQAGQSYEYVAYAVPAQPARHLYVIDDASSDVLVFLAGSNGNVAPVYRIKNVGGNNSAPQGIAEDANGRIYVTTIAADGKTTSLLVFAPGAHGNAKPVRIITGPQTTLTNNSSDTGVGPDGSVYVNGVKQRVDGGNGIAVFAPNADGDAKPARLIKGPNGGGAAVSPSGLLYATTALGTGNEASLDVFGPTEHGHQPPLATLEGPRAGIPTNLTAVDAQGNVYLCRNKAVIEFAPYQQGNVFPIRDIRGSNTGFVSLQPIAIDGAGNVFVADENAARIYRFAPQADGNVAPVAIIAGNNTGLVSPAAMAVGK